MRILLVEDNSQLLMQLDQFLQEQGFSVDLADDGEKAQYLLTEYTYDVIILDLGLPKVDGISVLKFARKNSINSPVCILTARDTWEQKVLGLDAGADDYITKPIKPKVLVSKVKSLLRRLKEKEDPQPEIKKVGKIVINREEYKVVNDGEEIILPRKEFELLSLLTSKPDKVFKREVILDKVWGQEVVVGGRTIDVHIRKLREKIGDHHFKTVKGVGYKFVL